MTMIVKALLQRGDQLETDGMVIPKDVLEDAAHEAPMETMFITKGYDNEQVVAFPLGLEMDGTDLYLEAKFLDKEMALKVKSGELGYGINGLIVKKHMVGNVTIVDELRLKSVGVFDGKELVKPALHIQTAKGYLLPGLEEAATLMRQEGKFSGAMQAILDQIRKIRGEPKSEG